MKPSAGMPIAFALALLVLAATPARAEDGPLGEALAWGEISASGLAGANVNLGWKQGFAGYEAKSDENVCFHCPNSAYHGMRTFKLGWVRKVEGILFHVNAGVGEYRRSRWAVDSRTGNEIKVFDTYTVYPLEVGVYFGWRYFRFGAKNALFILDAKASVHPALVLALGVMP